MARAAVLGGLKWRVGTVMAVRDETATARTLMLDVPDWPGHDAGQHVDLRLTAPDGYSTERSYSIASAPSGDLLELTIQNVPDGEVSPYLAGVLSVGDPLELRGPVGGWFVWKPGSASPALLLAGGSGVVPLMAMVRTRSATASTAPFRLVYSVRTPEDVIYRDELAALASSDPDLDVRFVYTRATPPGWPRPAGRIDAADLSDLDGGPHADVFVCGPNAFVETVTQLLLKAGHEPARIRTERFGSQGGTS